MAKLMTKMTTSSSSLLQNPTIPSIFHKCLSIFSRRSFLRIKNLKSLLMVNWCYWKSRFRNNLQVQGLILKSIMKMLKWNMHRVMKNVWLLIWRSRLLRRSRRRTRRLASRCFFNQVILIFRVIQCQLWYEDSIVVLKINAKFKLAAF